MKSFDFIVSLMFMKNIVFKNKILSESLQQEELNIMDVLGKRHISILSTRNVIPTLRGGGGGPGLAPSKLLYFYAQHSISTLLLKHCFLSMLCHVSHRGQTRKHCFRNKNVSEFLGKHFWAANFVSATRFPEVGKQWNIVRKHNVFTTMFPSLPRITVMLSLTYAKELFRNRCILVYI